MNKPTRYRALMAVGYLAMLALGMAIGYASPHAPGPGEVNVMVFTPGGNTQESWLRASLEVYGSIIAEAGAAGGILGFILGLAVGVRRRG